MKTTIRHLFAAGCAAALVGAGPVAAAEQLTFAVGFPSGSTVVQSLETFVEKAKEYGGPEIKLFPLSLLDLKQTGPGLRDHIVDMGYVIMPYHPAEYANSNLGADLNMLATVGERIEAPGFAMTGALTEYIMLDCPECVAEFARQQQIYLGGISTHDYALLCTTPIREVADLQGKKMRVAADNWGRWAEAMGATRVSISANETYEALSQGVVDCTVVHAADLLDLQLMDVTKYITLGVPGGLFAGVGAANINIDTWRGLSAEARAALLKAAAYNSADLSNNYYLRPMEALEQARANGIEIIEAGPELTEATEAFVAEDTAVIAELFTDNYGVENAGEKVATIRALVEKWKGLTRDVRDVETLAQIYEEEIFSKIDPATYGME
ncbi:C4-dicarboxylate TRAP transporter substrate-binding protein [Celeribacter indicus]|uniref:TRAP-T family protein transporter, DctP (Periplasmic binding) subunit n=1 Tax=Celeribacter indicus TaxID=1208324 RepID=A0A0B5E832_9RHOB|nr:C4-dicarboxylate TRAP transporter substrate-binding protein [Celeribacter indicus]AJE49171.1 TRAP-T family protein transporter, DctP (Periplasmic binding) subunit [Celeribacter indicus]SDX18081.1 TRAP-type C4-dicarboxylate transport system, substrate-binding protein [Celeribacter indicus]